MTNTAVFQPQSNREQTNEQIYCRHGAASPGVLPLCQDSARTSGETGATDRLMTSADETNVFTDTTWPEQDERCASDGRSHTTQLSLLWPKTSKNFSPSALRQSNRWIDRFHWLTTLPSIGEKNRLSTDDRSSLNERARPESTSLTWIAWGWGCDWLQMSSANLMKILQIVAYWQNSSIQVNAANRLKMFG